MRLAILLLSVLVATPVFAAPTPTAKATSIVGLQVTPCDSTLYVGETVQLVARDSSGTVKPEMWMAATPSVAKVSATGLVTAVSTGDGQVSALYDKMFETCMVSVVPAGAKKVKK